MILCIFLAEVTPIKTNRRIKTSHSFVNGSKIKDSSKQDEQKILSADFFKNNDTKSLMDYMPKTINKQMNERRILNTAGTQIMSNANILAPYNFYNSRNTNEIVENLTRDLNRKGGRTSKIQSHILSTQQQMLGKQLIQKDSNIKVSNKLHTSASANNVANMATNEFNSSLLNNSTNSATLFSTAFVNGNSQLKNQFEKITKSNNSPGFLTTLNSNIRPKVFK